MDLALPGVALMALSRPELTPEKASPLPDGLKVRSRRHAPSSGSSRQSADGKADHQVQPQPDGRKCAWCIHKDSDWDPVELKRQPPVYVFMWWSYPSAPDGKTVGTVCGYCKKIFRAQVKARGLTQNEYGNELGADPDRLEGHMALVQSVIQQIVSKGFVKNSHIQWETAIV